MMDTRLAKLLEADNGSDQAVRRSRAVRERLAQVTRPRRPAEVAGVAPEAAGRPLS